MQSLKKSAPISVEDEFAGGMQEITRSAPGGKQAGVIATITPSANAQGMGEVQNTASIPEQQNKPPEEAEGELQLEDLLALLDQDLIADMEFDEAWLESLPDGLYSYRGRRGGMRAVMAVQLLMFLHQQQTTNQQTIQLTQVQLQRQLQNMLAQFQQVVRLPEAAQKAAIAQILAQPQNAAAMTAVKQQLQASPELPARASFPQLAAAVATYVVTQSQPALVQFLNDAASRLSKGQLSPAAERHVQLVMDLAARVLNVQSTMAVPTLRINVPASPVRPPQSVGAIKTAIALQVPQLTTVNKTAAPELLSGIRQLLTRITGSPQPITSQQSVPTPATPIRAENSAIQPSGPAMRSQSLPTLTPNIHASVANLSVVWAELSALPLESKVPPSIQTIYRNTAAAINRAVTPPMLTVQAAREIPNRMDAIPTPAPTRSQNVDIQRQAVQPITPPISAPIIASPEILSTAPVISPTARVTAAPTIVPTPVAVQAAAPVSNQPPLMSTGAQPIQFSVVQQSVAVPPAPQPVDQIVAPRIATTERVIATPAAQNTSPALQNANPAPIPQSNVTPSSLPTAPEIRTEIISVPKMEPVPPELANQKKSEPAAEQKPQAQPATQPNQLQSVPQANPSPTPATPIATQGFNFAAPTNPANANVGVTHNTIADCCKDGQTQTPAQSSGNETITASQSGQNPPPGNTNTAQQPAANPLAKFRQSKQRN